MSNQLFYGTRDRFVYKLMTQSFRLDDYGVKGVYLCSTKEFASSWGKFILTCKLKEDARILWSTACDSKSTSCLNSDILMSLLWPEFWEDSPLELQFKKNEIIAVYNYIIDNCYKGKRWPLGCRGGRLSLFQRKYFQFFKHLKYHGFDGVGFASEAGPELLILDPTYVQPVSVHRWNYKMKNASPVLPLSELKAIEEQAELECCKDVDERGL